MKLKLRVIISMFITCSVLGLLSFIYYVSMDVTSEGDEELDGRFIFQRRVPAPSRHHGPKVERFVANHSALYLLPQHNNTSPLADSNGAHEVSVVSDESLLLYNLGRDRSKSVVSSPSRIDDDCDETRYKKTDQQDHSKGDYADLSRLLDMLPADDEDDGNGSFKENSVVTIQEILGITPHENLTDMESFYLKISSKEMYRQDEPLVQRVLSDMATLPIVNVDEKEGGTQLKLILTFEDGSQALFKPMRFGRKKETAPNHFYFVDFERHVSEIAAFHLDRILGFRRTPPVVGRLLNITSEIYAFADDKLLKTFFISPANNICFHGSCSYYCDTGHAICGRPDMLEGSLAMFLPPDGLSRRKAWRNPWRRSYHKRRKAEWEVNENYCEGVRAVPPYKRPERLAGVIDMAILDFLMGNMDRHHYETFKVFGNKSFIIHLDHGRGFGRSNHDEISILAPLYQCCFLRFATFRRLMELYTGPRDLSDLMRCSLHDDPLDPILIERHLKALDRRLVIILDVIRDCLTRFSAAELLYRPKEE